MRDLKRAMLCAVLVFLAVMVCKDVFGCRERASTLASPAARPTHHPGPPTTPPARWGRRLEEKKNTMASSQGKFLKAVGTVRADMLANKKQKWRDHIKEGISGVVGFTMEEGKREDLMDPSEKFNTSDYIMRRVGRRV